MYQGNARRTGASISDTSADTGAIVRTIDLGSKGGGSPVLGLRNNSSVIYTASSNDLAALNPDGSTLWRFAIGDSLPSAPAVGVDGTTYIGALSGTFYAVNPDGTLKWTFSPPSCSTSLPPTPAIGPSPSDHSLLAYDVYINNNCGDIYVLKPDGTLEWQSFAMGWWRNFLGPVAISSDGSVDAVYSCYGDSCEAGLFSLTSDGNFKWKFGVGSVWVILGPAIGSGGTAYFVTQSLGVMGSTLYAVNPDGTLKWKSATHIEIGFGRMGPSIGGDGTIYLGGFNPFGGAEGGLQAFNPDGSLKWTFLGEPGVMFSAPAISGDGTLFATSTNLLYAINPNGTPKRTSLMPCDPYDNQDSWENSPVIDSDGTVYVHCGESDGNDAQLIAIH
jgi:hypothetical protein